MLTRFLFPAAGLFSLWLLLSGHYSMLLVSLGVVCSLGVALLAWRLGVTHQSHHVAHFLLRLPLYLPWFIREVVKSNLDVARRIWHPRLPISPRIITVRASQQTELGIAVHANSITLTPGTLSIDASEGQIQVHALAHEIAVGLAEGEMDRRVRALEKNL